MLKNSPALQYCASNAASGLGSDNKALGEGSVGGQQYSGKGADSQAGGRESGDSESSIKGDTSSQPNVNNEYPANADAGANIKTDSTSAKFSAEGSSEASSATQ
ncbi:hypothetical protein Rhopal_001741-T1 [Rhodotorula paludigena]|uniref:Uncharacterized protein n=1 Tax=Rhodotorula paludigena TaxID=86838 RepID=A0AAV5GHE2_9BASI|nr:hypothetical protein Rhopal_001741-T1 [Rhodotorula paludigena]